MVGRFIAYSTSITCEASLPPIAPSLSWATHGNALNESYCASIGFDITPTLQAALSPARAFVSTLSGRSTETAILIRHAGFKQRSFLFAKERYWR
jgi:hypothetical protein